MEVRKRWRWRWRLGLGLGMMMRVGMMVVWLGMGGVSGRVIVGVSEGEGDSTMEGVRLCPVRVLVVCSGTKVIESGGNVAVIVGTNAAEMAVGSIQPRTLI